MTEHKEPVATSEIIEEQLPNEGVKSPLTMVEPSRDNVENGQSSSFSDDVTNSNAISENALNSEMQAIEQQAESLRESHEKTALLSVNIGNRAPKPE